MVQSHQDLQSWMKTLGGDVDMSRQLELARAEQLRSALRLAAAYEEEAYYDKRGYGSERQESRVEGESRNATSAYCRAVNKVKELEDIIEA